MKRRDGNKVRREERQASAKVRQEVAATRTPAQRLASLDAAKLTATKERAKLAKLLNPKKVETVEKPTGAVQMNSKPATVKVEKKAKKRKDAA